MKQAEIMMVIGEASVCNKNDKTQWARVRYMEHESEKIEENELL